MKAKSHDEAIEVKRPRGRASSPLIQRRLLAISESTTPDGIADAVTAAAECIGFPVAQLMVVNITPKPTAFVLREASDRMLRYDRAVIVGSDLAGVCDADPAARARDLVLRRLRQCLLPVAWDGHPGVDSDPGSLGRLGGWSVGADPDHGISMQVPVAVDDFTRLLTVVVSVQRAQPIRCDEHARLSADVALMAMHAAVGSKRALVPLLLEAVHDASPLTPAMRQYLAWAERGKTAGETAEIVGRKYSTVKNVLAQAIERMGCSGKADAVRLARANGWL